MNHDDDLLPVPVPDRPVLHGSVQWTPEDREAAYHVWREAGSLSKAARRLPQTESVLATWCHRYGWIKRRQEDDAREQQLALQRAFVKVVRKVDPLIDNLLMLAMEGEKEDGVRFNATKYALALVGIQPVDQKAIQVKALGDASSGPRVVELSDDERAAIAARLGED